MALILSVLFAGALAFVLYHVRAWSARRAFARQQGCQLPPERHIRNPILGKYYKFQNTRSADPFKSLPTGAALHSRYGPTYRESTWFGQTIKTSSAANLQAVYGTKAKDFGVQPFRLAGMRPFCGEGLLTTDGAVWERSRTMIKPSFHKNNISDLSAFKRSVEHLIARIPKDGSTIDMQHLIALMFSDTSAHFLLGHPLGMLDTSTPLGVPVDGKSFLRAWQLSLRSCSIRNSLGILRFKMSKVEIVDQWQIVHKLISFHVDRALDGMNPYMEKGHHSLLENLIAQTRNRIEIRNQIIQGMMAAQDTTSVLISNAIFLLSRHPKLWERLRYEVASLNLDEATAEDTTKFKLVRNILHESLRLYPVFANLARIALKDSVLPEGGGFRGDQPVFVRAGTRILADFYTLHRNESVYGEDVESFKPDRWESVRPSSWQFMAFGGGQRACLGQQKALAEASYTLIRLAQTFKRIESRDDREWAGDQKLTAKNAHGCKVAMISA